MLSPFATVEIIEAFRKIIIIVDCKQYFPESRFSFSHFPLLKKAASAPHKSGKRAQFPILLSGNVNFPILLYGIPFFAFWKMDDSFPAFQFYFPESIVGKLERKNEFSVNLTTLAVNLKPGTECT